jgi:hypothetical protein
MQEVTQPRHAGGIEASRRLIENKDRRIPEQSTSESQSLAHTVRVAADSAGRRRGQVDEVEHLVDTTAWDTGGPGNDTQVVPPGSPWVEASLVENRADTPPR